MIVASLLLALVPSIINPFTNFVPRVPCPEHNHTEKKINTHLEKVNRRVSVMDVIWSTAQATLDKKLAEGKDPQESVNQFWFAVMPSYKRAKAWYLKLTEEFCNEAHRQTETIRP